MAGFRTVLVRPKEPGNVGSVARAMSNFALHELYLVAPKRPIDAQARAYATHGAHILGDAVLCDSVLEAIGDCSWVLGTTARSRKTPSFEIYTPREAASMFRHPGGAILFGPEDFGLSNEDLDYCQGYIRIPTGEHASLNLAHASAIVAYEWFVASEQGVAPPARVPARREALERMYDQLLDVLLLIGYTDSERAANANRLMRGIFDRAALGEREVAALRGLWSQVEWAALSDPDALSGRRFR